jgi:hypothetical protein
VKPLSIPAAIAREEGWTPDVPSPPARCRRNLNPGNIDFSLWTIKFGGRPETAPEGGKARFACFPSSAQGFAALRALLGFPRYKGRSLADAIGAWAPPVENQTSAYLRNVCAWTELTPDTIIDAHLGDALDDPD